MNVDAHHLSRTYAKSSSEGVDWNRLAEKFLPLVKHEVMRFAIRLPSHIEADDLYGVAVGGLMRALPRYADSNEKAFAAYLRQRVRGAMVDELRRLDCVSRTARKKARLYDEAVVRVEQREGRQAEEAEIREELGMKPSDFAAFLEEIRPISFLSLHESVPGDEGGGWLIESVADPSNVPVPESIERDELKEILRDRIERLPDVQKKVLMLYYFEDFRLAEIARVFSLSESRICQLHTQAVRGLRNLMRPGLKQ